MKELYKKVFIKTESDLPKEEGTYVVFLDDNEMDIFKWQKTNIGFLTKDWMYYAKAYLIPLESVPVSKLIEKYRDFFKFIKEALFAFSNTALLKESESERPLLECNDSEFLNDVFGKEKVCPRCGGDGIIDGREFPLVCPACKGAKAMRDGKIKPAKTEDNGK